MHIVSHIGILADTINKIINLGGGWTTDTATLVAGGFTLVCLVMAFVGREGGGSTKSQGKLGLFFIAAIVVAYVVWLMGGAHPF